MTALTGPLDFTLAAATLLADELRRYIRAARRPVR